MHKTLRFQIAVLFYIVIYVISAKEMSENDEVISQTVILDYKSVNTTEHNEFRFRGSELDEAHADDCKCKNGKCMRSCDIKKEIPCLDKTMVCVCNPEFGKKHDGECEFCDCGQGFDCVFQKIWYDTWKQTCTCPEGYYNENSYSFKDRCKAECNLERPCQNGGNCKRKECVCLRNTKGDLCEEITGCSPECTINPEMICLYDQLKEVSYCGCRDSSLFYDQDANVCKPCPCENGNCVYKVNSFYQELKCDCYSGYEEYKGYCKICTCGPSREPCRFGTKGEKICGDCLEGFYKREGFCRPCGCSYMGDTSISCEVTGNEKRCFCKEGYQDFLGNCEDIDECETNNPCQPSATCYNTIGSFYCKCNKGYIKISGDQGDSCEDVDECAETLLEHNPCWNWDMVKCVNVPGSYKCECLRGYEPRSYGVEPHKTTCINTSKSWGPALIVIFTTVALIIVSWAVHVRVKKRATGSN